MREAILRDFFIGRCSADTLVADLGPGFEQSGRDSRVLRSAPMDEEFEVEPEHLIRLCDAVLTGDVRPEALEVVGFALIASDHFAWDTDSPGGICVGETLYDWSAPEMNYPLRVENVRKFRHRLATGEDLFTRADTRG